MHDDQSQQPDNIETLEELSREDDASADSMTIDTDLGGTVDPSHIVDSNNDASRVGDLGHPGIDEDTG